MTYVEIERAALKLGPHDRIRLAAVLWESVDDSLELAWAAESIRRLKELEAGTARDIPLEIALRRARAAVGRTS